MGNGKICGCFANGLRSAARQPAERHGLAIPTCRCGFLHGFAVVLFYSCSAAILLLFPLHCAGAATLARVRHTFWLCANDAFGKAA